MRQIEGKHVVTNNFWIISFQMFSDDFENFAGKTQTSQVKQNPSDQQFPVCVCSFCFISFPLLLYLSQGKSKIIPIFHSCRKLWQSSIYFSSSTLFIFLIKSRLLCSDVSWFCERRVASGKKTLEREMSPSRLRSLLTLLFNIFLIYWYILILYKYYNTAL